MTAAHSSSLGDDPGPGAHEPHSVEDSIVAPPTRPTAVATSIASIVGSGAFPEEAAAHLARLLGHDLALPSRSSQRYARLGLLIDLVAGDGEFVPSTEYERERRARAAKGESWPAAETLARAYGGHWLTAVKAAARFFFDGGPGRVPASHGHCSGPGASYLPPEILTALFTCRRELELELEPTTSAATEQPTGASWPTRWEYLEWVRIKRDLARRSGNECRLPGIAQIRKAYGGYDQAIRAAAAHRDRALRGA